MMRSSYLAVDQAQLDAQIQLTSPTSGSIRPIPMPRSNWASPISRSNRACLIPGVIEVNPKSGFVKVNPISAIQLR